MLMPCCRYLIIRTLDLIIFIILGGTVGNNLEKETAVKNNFLDLVIETMGKERSSDEIYVTV